MYRLNRQQCYEKIKEAIQTSEIGYSETYGDQKSQMLEYLEEMNNCWHENYVDMTDRQYLTILPADGEEKEQPEGKRLNLRKDQ